MKIIIHVKPPLNLCLCRLSFLKEFIRIIILAVYTVQLCVFIISFPQENVTIQTLYGYVMLIDHACVHASSRSRAMQICSELLKQHMYCIVYSSTDQCGITGITYSMHAIFMAGTVHVLSN